MRKYHTTAISGWSLWISYILFCSEAFEVNLYSGNASHASNDSQLLSSEWLPSDMEAYAFEPIISDPLIEDVSFDFLNSSNRKTRREEILRGFSDSQKKELLDLHNMYRGNVTPPAGNMEFMEWDEKLEELAQLWANGCVFQHGKPPNTSYPGPYGQNLYIGTDPTGYKALWLWYEEHLYYDLRNQVCEEGQQCGHYVQMAWAESRRLGCGVTKCGLRYLIVCHYYQPALKGTQMYDVSRPCSQCSGKEESYCVNNLCMDRDQCGRNAELCDTARCNLKCKNCGKLNETSCRCACADGWDSSDCSRPCEDEHERCGSNPGFPNKASCPFNRHMVGKKFCRKMCEYCNPYTKGIKISHTCCGGITCKKGYVLDLIGKPCRCILDCPGPHCDFMYGYGILLQFSILKTLSQLISLYFISGCIFHL